MLIEKSLTSRNRFCVTTLLSLAGIESDKGDAATRMPGACPNVSLGRCAPLRQGWLNGTHPKTVVTRMDTPKYGKTLRAGAWT